MHGTLIGAVVEIKCRWCTKRNGGREVVHRWRILKHRAVLLEDEDNEDGGR